AKDTPHPGEAISREGASRMVGGTGDTTSNDPMPSWNDTPSKRAITAFVQRVARAGSPEFVPEPERIAVFDNDGTLWGWRPQFPSRRRSCMTTSNDAAQRS